MPCQLVNSYHHSERSYCLHPPRSCSPSRNVNTVHELTDPEDGDTQLLQNAENYKDLNLQQKLYGYYITTQVDFLCRSLEIIIQL